MSNTANETIEIKDTEIDTILDEIEENEQKIFKNRENENAIDWEEILEKLRAKQVNFIKNMISSKEINVNSRNPTDGKTLLIHAVIIGDLAFVKAICNFGANVHIKDHDELDAMNYAIKYGRYKITELLYYRQLSGSLGNDLKHISMEIHTKNKEAEYIYQSDAKLCENIINFMVKAIQERAPFDPSMFYYSWYFACKRWENPFRSPLWETMMTVYGQILSNTKDTEGWRWLKRQYIASLIWYLPHPDHVERDPQDNEPKLDALGPGEVDYVAAFTENRLGLELVSDEDGLNCFVSGCVSTTSQENVASNSRIIKVNDQWVGSRSYSKILGAIKEAKAVITKQNPLQITFRIKMSSLPPHFQIEQRKQTQEEKDDAPEEHDTMDSVLQKTMFYELLVRVKKESKKQSDILLKKDIDLIKNETRNEWNQLVAYTCDVNTKYSSNARQDVCGCLIPKYNEHDLSDEIYPPSTHFSAKKHYDTKIYLNELLFQANIINEQFQNDMKMITKEINTEIGSTVTFRMGPVKTLTRSQVKVENDYINEDYPTSAKILDINRCALQFSSIPSMLKFLEIFTKKVNSKSGRSITEIIRCKNGWSVYDPEYPQYTDIKLNVLVHSKHDGAIIAEIQFLLDLISKFKKKAHKLYSIERKFELVYQHQLLTDEMQTFKDNENESSVWAQIVTDDEVNSFQLLWESHVPHANLLLTEFKAKSKMCNRLVASIITSETGKINNYFNQNYKAMYREALLRFFSDHAHVQSGTSWDLFFDEITSNALSHNITNLFVQRLLSLFEENDKESLTKLILFKQWGGYSLFQTLCKNGTGRSIDALQRILFDANMSDSDKCKSFSEKNFINQIPSNFAKVLQSLQSEANGKQIVDKLLMIFDISTCPMICQHKAFNYYTFTTPNYAVQYKCVDDKDYYSAYAMGSLCCFGKGKDGQLGLAAKDRDDHPTPTVCPTFNDNNCMQISSGYSSLCIDSNGDVFAWGKQLMFKPTLLKSLCKYPHKALNVAVGESHSLILTEDGKVWSFGNGVYGCLGHGNMDSHNTPKLIESLSDNHIDIVHISCGSGYSCVVTRDGELWSFGNNRQGQCGLGKNDETLLHPTPVRFTSTKIFLGKGSGMIRTVDCGATHTLILTKVIGQCELLQCGNNQFLPKTIAALKTKHIMDISAGHDFNLCVTRDGELYSWGIGSSGQLGHGDEAKQVIPKRVEFFKDKKISLRSCHCGFTHSGVITSNNDVYLWGAGDKGQLGQGIDDMQNKSLPTKAVFFDAMPVKTLSLGDEFTAVIAEIKDDFKDNGDEDEKEEAKEELILKGNQEVNVKNRMENCVNNKAFQILIQNDMIFGDTNWVWMQSNTKQYSPFPCYTTSFINNLQINDEQIIELIHSGDIAGAYHSEILNAKYLLLVNESKTIIKKEEVGNYGEDQLYDFSHAELKDIKFKFTIPESETKKDMIKISIFVQPQKECDFCLLKNVRRYRS
eukprot:209890_1